MAASTAITIRIGISGEEPLFLAETSSPGSGWAELREPAPPPPLAGWELVEPFPGLV
jgi:hypothetical protein